MPPLTAAQKRQKEKDKKRKAKEMEAVRQEHAEYDAQHGNVGDQRAAELSTVDKQLAALGLQRVSVAADGNCLFASLADQSNRSGRVPGATATASSVRKVVVEYMRARRDEYRPFLAAQDPADDDGNKEDMPRWEAYCTSLEQDGTWGSVLEVQAAARRFGVAIDVVQSSGVSTFGEEKDKEEVSDGIGNGRWVIVHLRHYYTLGEHFDSTLPTTTREAESASSLQQAAANLTVE